MCFLFIAIFKALGSKHMQSVPSGLCGYISEDTHSFGSVTGIFSFKSTIFDSFFLLLPCILLVLCALCVALGV